MIHGLDTGFLVAAEALEHAEYVASRDTLARLLGAPKTDLPPDYTTPDYPIAFQMVAGRQVFRHPSIQGRHYILDKLTAFHRDHDTGMAEVLRDLQAAVAQVPPREYVAEAKPLAEELQKIHDGRRRGPQLLGDILPIVLARLGVGAIQSAESGE